MNSIYNSSLHHFVEGYLHAVGAQIEEKYNEFFIVLFPDGTRKKYTYHPKTASENKDIELLAKGSKSLREMVQQCSSKTAYSSVKMSYTFQSVSQAIRPKGCCDLCPFITICENTGKCCSFCYNFKNCNTRIENADFIGLGHTHTSSLHDIICFIFTVELSNDYSLSQKIEKNITVLIDIKTGKILDSVLAKDLVHLETAPLNIPLIDQESLPRYLRIARLEAENLLKEQLDVFKKEIEGPLKDKITSILSKYEEDYADNYTKTSIEQLDELQAEAIKLCEREIRGYTINSSFHLKNTIVIQSAKDRRDMIFKLHGSRKEIILSGDLFLSRIDISCSRCGVEIDSGSLCDEGHILCSSCRETCCTCGKILCHLCDQETYLCATCGSPVCPDCSVKCHSCGAVVCADHGYQCGSCDHIFCIDCHEICVVCESNVCNHDLERCYECDEAVCSEHAHTCSACSQPFCNDHINKCTVCGTLLCEEHAMFSAFSDRTVCENHTSSCAVCNDTFAADEVKSCTQCGDILCPSHAKVCSKCEKVHCSKHVNHCRSCGKEVCSCTEFKTCKLCGEEYCADCFDDKGYCRACYSLEPAPHGNTIIAVAIQAVPELEGYRKFYIGEADEVKILYAKGLFSNMLIMMNSQNEVLWTKDIGFLGDIKRKLKL